VHYGIPIEADEAAQKEILTKYGEDERLDYRWIYR